MALQPGDRAPAFDLEQADGGRVTLDDFAGKWLVLYFYPRDNTPGCTRQAQAFTAGLKRLRTMGADVAGVSRDSVKSHCGFRDKYEITFPLLSDPNLVTHKAYGVWGIKKMYGKSVEGTIRSTFLIAPDGHVAHAWNGVKVDGHVEKVEAALLEAKGGSSPRPPKQGPGAPPEKDATPRSPKRGAAASPKKGPTPRSPKRGAAASPKKGPTPRSPKRGAAARTGAASRTAKKRAGS